MIKVINNKSLPKYKIMNVLVDGVEYTPSSLRVSKEPFNTPWPGHQRPFSQTEENGYFHIVTDKEEIEITIKPNIVFDKYYIRPISYDIKPIYENGLFKLYLKPGKYVFELDDFHNALHIIVDIYRDFKEYGNPTITFDEGVHILNKIELKSGDRVFLKENSHVKGFIISKNVSNVRIYGYGILDDSLEIRNVPDCYSDKSNGCLRMYDSSDIIIDSITLIDSSNWVVSMFYSNYIHINNINIVGHYKYNTDGIDIVNSRDISVSNSLIHVFDDAICIKGIYDYKEYDSENILIENNILWCGWGRSLEIGLETLCNKISNVKYYNCNLIHNSAVAMDIQSGDYAEIYDIEYKNINVEFNHNEMMEIMEDCNNSIYKPILKDYMPKLINISTYEYFLGDYFKELDEKMSIVRKNRYSHIHNIIYNGIKVYKEKENKEPIIDYNVKEPNVLDKPTINYEVIIYGDQNEEL